MPLILLGLVFVIAMFAFYLLSTMGNSSPKKKENSLKKEENVIFLPNDLEREKHKHKH